MSRLAEYVNGDKFWHDAHEYLHRENDLPAVIFTSGSKSWWIHGIRHRENDQPAIEYWNGDKQWYVNGKHHRENDQPAIKDIDGHKEWWYNGKRHRENGKPAIESANGTKIYFLNGVNITSFRSKYMEARKLRAQKKIYFWIIKKLYRPGSESAKRLSEMSWKNTCKLK